MNKKIIIECMDRLAGKPKGRWMPGREVMEQEMYDRTSDSAIDSLYDKIMGRMREDLADPIECGSNTELQCSLRMVHRHRLESIAMAAAMTIYEQARWLSSEPGTLEHPAHIIAGVEMFMNDLEKHLTAIFEHFVDLVESKNREAEAEDRPTEEVVVSAAPDQFCFTGCECAECQAIRARQTAIYGGEVVPVDAQALQPREVAEDLPF